MKRPVLMFDVDGTITYSGKPVPDEVITRLETLASTHDIFFVTGSPYNKISKQLINCNFPYQLFTDMGNCWYENGKIRKISPVSKLDQLFNKPNDNGISPRKFLDATIENSNYPLKIGPHFEFRNNTINFSIIGRDANDIERLDYFYWDNFHFERLTICQQLFKIFPDISCQIGGQISIDIFQKGYGKEQILKHNIFRNRPITFFGDRIDPFGNDYSLAQKLNEMDLGKSIPVLGYMDLLYKLNSM